jgi:excisionase family DNA binding protein
MSSDHPLTLTVEQAGQVLGIGRSTAYELVRTGEIESIRLRRRIVVPIGALAELLGVSPAEVRCALETHPSAGAQAPRRRSMNKATEAPTLF